MEESPIEAEASTSLSSAPGKGSPAAKPTNGAPPLIETDIISVVSDGVDDSDVEQASFFTWSASQSTSQNPAMQGSPDGHLSVRSFGSFPNGRPRLSASNSDAQNTSRFSVASSFGFHSRRSLAMAVGADEHELSLMSKNSYQNEARKKSGVPGSPGIPRRRSAEFSQSTWTQGSTGRDDSSCFTAVAEALIDPCFGNPDPQSDAETGEDFDQTMVVLAFAAMSALGWVFGLTALIAGLVTSHGLTVARTTRFVVGLLWTLHHLVINYPYVRKKKSVSGLLVDLTSFSGIILLGTLAVITMDSGALRLIGYAAILSCLANRSAATGQLLLSGAVGVLFLLRQKAASAGDSPVPSCLRFSFDEDTTEGDTIAEVVINAVCLDVVPLLALGALLSIQQTTQRRHLDRQQITIEVAMSATKNLIRFDHQKVEETLALGAGAGVFDEMIGVLSELNSHLATLKPHLPQFLIQQANAIINFGMPDITAQPTGGAKPRLFSPKSNATIKSRASVAGNNQQQDLVPDDSEGNLDVYSMSISSRNGSRMVSPKEKGSSSYSTRKSVMRQTGVVDLISPQNRKSKDSRRRLSSNGDPGTPSLLSAKVGTFSGTVTTAYVDIGWSRLPGTGIADAEHALSLPPASALDRLSRSIEHINLVALETKASVHHLVGDAAFCSWNATVRIGVPEVRACDFALRLNEVLTAEDQPASLCTSIANGSAHVLYTGSSHAHFTIVSALMDEQHRVQRELIKSIGRAARSSTPACFSVSIASPGVQRAANVQFRFVACEILPKALIPGQVFAAAKRRKSYAVLPGAAPDRTPSPQPENLGSLDFFYELVDPKPEAVEEEWMYQLNEGDDKDPFALPAGILELASLGRQEPAETMMRLLPSNIRERPAICHMLEKHVGAVAEAIPGP